MSEEVHEPWIERVIREATERGEFDDLPGSGKPIPDLDRPYDPSWWARKWTNREQLIERAAALDALVRRELPSLIADPDRRRARERVAEINAAVAALNDHLPEAERLREVRLPDDRAPSSG